MKKKRIMLCLCSAALAMPFVYGSLFRNVSAAGNENTKSAVPRSIAIDEKNFPDANFRKIVNTFDWNEDGFLSIAERMDVKEFDSREYGECEIKSLKGIGYFAELEYLNCIGNKIKELDLSENTKLLYLNCSGNPIQSLDCSNNKELIELVYVGSIASDDVVPVPGGFDQKQERDVGVLSSLNVTECTELAYLTVSENVLTELDISNNTKLVELYCHANQLTELDVHANTKLEALICYDNQITSLDVHTNERLEWLDCGSNQLTSLDVHANEKLTSLQCDNNQLTSLDIRTNKKLISLGCGHNKITSLDVSKFLNLQILRISDNPITSIDLSKNTMLTELYCINNGLTSLDLTNKYQLYCLFADGNKLETLDIRQTHISKHFDVSELKDRGTYYFFSSEGTLDDCKEDYCWFTFDKNTTIKSGPKAEQPKEPTFEDFVERLYTVALNRESDSEGKAFWVKQVVEEGKTGADCARFFLLDAPEFMERNLSTEDFVETLYATFFDRESDEEGKAGWIDAINSGKKTRAEVVNDFIESTEWCDVCATYGVKSGAVYHKATKASSNARNFASRLYTCCLGRDAEDDGLNYWALALTNLEKTGAEAARFFFESDEFIGFKLSDEEYIRRLYSTFMGREPVESEVDYWLGEIAGGRQTRHSILAFFAQSEEFTRLCKTYGIDRGEIA